MREWTQNDGAETLSRTVVIELFQTKIITNISSLTGTQNELWYWVVALALMRRRCQHLITRLGTWELLVPGCASVPEVEVGGLECDRIRKDCESCGNQRKGRWGRAEKSGGACGGPKMSKMDWMENFLLGWDGRATIRKFDRRTCRLKVGSLIEPLLWS